MLKTVDQFSIVRADGLGFYGALRCKILRWYAYLQESCQSVFEWLLYRGHISTISHPLLVEIHHITSLLMCRPRTLAINFTESCSQLGFYAVTRPGGWPYRIVQNTSSLSLVYDRWASLSFVNRVVHENPNYRWWVNPINEEVVFQLASTQFAIPIALASALRAKVGQVKILTSGDLKRWFIDVDYKPSVSLTIVTPIVADWLGGEKSVDLIHYMYPIALADYLPESSGKHSVTLVEPNPLSLPSFAPIVNEASDLAAVHLRLQNIRNHMVPDEFIPYAEEFVALLVAGSHHCFPWEQHEVLEVQDRPMQKARNRQAVVQLEDYGRLHTNSFVKQEAYVADKAPRNISNVMVKHNIELSRYTYPFKKEILSKQHWYMPARSMTEIAEALQSFHRAYGPNLVETDFSKFDGTISRWLRENVEFRAYAAIFPEMLPLLRKELDCVATTTTGYKYSADGSRLSGSPATTDGNTMIAAFVDYLASRREGCSPETAYARIGLHFGDDGVSAPLPLLEETANLLGLNLKCLPKSQFIGFLGRIYPDPSLSLGSFQDPVRVWSRITTLAGNVPQEQQLPRLRAKFSSYLRSDAKTPFLGDYLRKWLEEHPGPVFENLSDLPFLHRGAEEWPELELVEMARDYILSELNMDDNEIAFALGGGRIVREIVPNNGSEHIEGASVGVAATIIAPDESLNTKRLIPPLSRVAKRRNYFRRSRGFKNC